MSTLYFKDTRETPDYAWDTEENWWLSCDNTGVVSDPAEAIPSTGDNVHIVDRMDSGATVPVSLLDVVVGLLGGDFTAVFSNITVTGEFSAWSGVFINGTIIGTCFFSGSSTLGGSIAGGSADFYGDSSAIGASAGSGVPFTFHDYSAVSGSLTLDGAAATFLDYSGADGATITGDVVLKDNSTLLSSSVASGGVNASGSSVIESCDVVSLTLRESAEVIGGTTIGGDLIDRRRLTTTAASIYGDSSQYSSAFISGSLLIQSPELDMVGSALF